MNREKKSAYDWFGEFNRIHEGIAKTRSIAEGFAKWVWDKVVAKDVIPTQMPTEVTAALSTLEQELRSIEQASENLRWTICGNPLEKWRTGQHLTREEFYLLAAQGIIIIPSETGSLEAYEEFAHYLYEDNELRGYINPSERPDTPPTPTGNGKSTQKVHLKIGIVPEEVRISFLRTEQLNFFRDFKPELFSRFRED